MSIIGGKDTIITVSKEYIILISFNLTGTVKEWKDTWHDYWNARLNRPQSETSTSYSNPDY